MKEAKQIIIIRKDLNMRKGKSIAQGAHASMAVFFNLMKDEKTGYLKHEGDEYHAFFKHKSEAVHNWMTVRFKKICVYVNSEQELLDLYELAKSKGLLCSLIKDAGLTEFKEPTHTSVAIGPDWDENIDPLTKHLPLY